MHGYQDKMVVCSHLSAYIFTPFHPVIRNFEKNGCTTERVCKAVDCLRTNKNVWTHSRDVAPTLLPHLSARSRHGTEALALYLNSGVRT